MLIDRLMCNQRKDFKPLIVLGYVFSVDVRLQFEVESESRVFGGNSDDVWRLIFFI